MEAKKPVLVIGGCGFIGSHLVRSLVTLGFRIKILDICTKEQSLDIFRELPKDSFEFIQGSIDNPNIIDSALMDCIACVHLVSTTVPATSNKNKIIDIKTNLLPSVSLLEIAKEKNIKKIIYLSSGGAVYGNSTIWPINENHPTNPISSYGIVKLAIEKYFFMFRELYGLNTVVLRLSNPFGYGQNGGSIQGIIPLYIKKILQNQPIDIIGDGETIRDYIYITDVINAIIASLLYEGSETVFNIGSGHGTSINELVFLIKNIIQKDVQIHYLPSRKFDVKANVLDITKASDHLDWKPQVSLEDGVRILINQLSPSPPNRG